MVLLDEKNKEVNDIISINHKYLQSAIKEGLYEGLRVIISKDPEFCFGFTGFKPEHYSSYLVGQILCVVHTDTAKGGRRFFACNLAAPGNDPKPFEYNKGDMFFIEDGAKWDISELFRVSEHRGEVLDSLYNTIKALAKFVIQSL